MRAILLTIGLIASVSTAAAEPQGTLPAGSGIPCQHPAMAAHCVPTQQGYDYASKFYPHPAWLYLSTEAPRPMSPHPAVIVFQRAQEQRRLALEAATLQAATLP